jgi:type III secretion protein D
MNSAPAYELRVLSGQQRGAASAVSPGDTLRIGRDWSSDVVLQQAGDSVALLAMDANGQLTLKVEAGPCLIQGGAALDAGEQAQLAPYAAFTLCDVRMAVGRIGAPQWAALFDGAGAGPATGAQASAEAPAQAPAQEPAQTPAATGSPATSWIRRPHWVRRFLLGGAALMGVSVGTLALALAISPASVSLPEQAEYLRQSLAHSGFGALKVEIRDNELLVTGHLNTLAQRGELERSLPKQTPARLAVWTNDQVTASVGEVYRLNGITAEVRSSGAGVVQVQTHEADTAALDKAQAVARRDVPGLVQLEPVNDPPPASRPEAAIPNDPGKRLAAIVPGDPAYVVTVDNTRYFEGAMLPTGHHIVSILSDHIQIERDGVVSDLKF